jgi:periplasmic protein TonB
METKVLVLNTWEDLVFAYRNKAYGAYAIRKAYSRRLLIGLGVSTALMIFLLLLPGIVEQFNGRPAPFVKRPDLRVYDIGSPPTIILREKIRKAETVVNANAQNTTILVTREKVDAPVEHEVVFAHIPDEGTGESGVVDGEGVSPAVEAPVVVEKKPEIFIIAEVMPEYEGGMEALMKFVKRKLRYPATPRRLAIDGTVYVSFVVNGDGSVRDVSVLRGIHRDCDEEAARVISMLPGWKGGRQGGSPVAVKMVLPIKFNLQ